MFMSLIAVFRRRGRFCLSGSMGLLRRFSQEEPFDLSQKPPGLPSLRLSQSDGESVPGSSCQEEEDEESFYKRSQYSPEVDQHEPAGKDQYSPDLEEGRQEERGKRKHRRKLHDQVHHRRDQRYESDAAAEGRSVGPVGDQVTPEQVYESDSELGEQMYERGHRKLYGYDSDSELGDDIPHRELDEPEPDKEELGGFSEPTKRKSRRLEPGEIAHRSPPNECIEVTDPQDEEEEEGEKEDKGREGEVREEEE